MLFNIAPQNAEKARKAFTTAKPAHVYGYTKAAILTPKNRRMSFYYEIDIIQDIIVCTIRHKETDTMEAVAVFRSFTPESIEIEKADLYRNCSNYPYRTETADRYMRKYDQIACIVHGAIAAGLLYDTQEATTSAETIEDKENTTRNENRPQEAKETAKKTDMETFKKEYSRIYNHLYEHEGHPGADATRRKYSRLFDEMWEQIKDIAKAFCTITGDLLTSDRECAAFMKALETVGAPTDGETATDGQATTTPETDAQRAAESAEKTADDTTPTAEDTEPQEATQTAGTSEGADTTTPPHKEPPRAAERAAAAAGGSVSQSDRTTRPAAPQSHGTNVSGQRTTGSDTRPPRGKTRDAPSPPGKQRNFCFFGLTGKNRSEKSKLST